jgi:hypothetical protein
MLPYQWRLFSAFFELLKPNEVSEIFNSERNGKKGSAIKRILRRFEVSRPS